METSDNDYQSIQRQRAETMIARIAKRLGSNERRIKELDYYRDLYQAYGWQTATDSLLPYPLY